MRDSRWKLIKASSSLTVSEEHNVKMQRQYNEELAALQEKLDTQQAEHRATRDQTEARCLAAVVEQERTQLELAAAMEQIEAKAATITRLELTLSADTARLEKKLHAQVRLFYNSRIYFDQNMCNSFMNCFLFVSE